jgi:hypothetical protein
MIQSAHGADPATEEAAEEKGGNENNETPEQPAVEGAAGESIGDRDQRIELEEKRNRRGEVQVSRWVRGRPKIRSQKKKDKKQEKKYLKSPADAGW